MKSRMAAGGAVVFIWAAVSVALAEVTHRVADWFVMTDELLYERLAISVDRLGSPLPHVHMESVANVNQLYPLLLAYLFRHGTVIHGFHEAHVVDPIVMASVVVPVYLLTWRLTTHRALSLVAALAVAAVPWMVLSSFLLTEVVAYPASAWALLALHAAVARPTVRNDLFAVAAVALAVFARTQLYALVIVLVLTILADGLVQGNLRGAARRHAALVAVIGVGVAAAVILLAAGHNPFGTYRQTAAGNPLPWDVWRLAAAHAANLALGCGVLPFVAGTGWVLQHLGRQATATHRAFAWLSLFAIVVIVVEVSSFDVRFGGGIVRDRYLLYLAPVVLISFAAALQSVRVAIAPLVVPVIVLALGFWQAPLPVFEKLNADTPVATLDNWLVATMHGTTGARVFLVLATIALALLYVEARLLAPRPLVAAAFAVALIVALPVETAYGFVRLFRVNGTSGLPMTLDQSIVFAWVDREITTTSDAVMIPYPVIRADFWSNIGFWWDLEFWNRSVDREAAPGSAFSATPSTFPKLDLRFDPRTGRANVDLDSYVAQAQDDARFHVAGRQLTVQRGVSIVFPDRPWHADWVSYGLYDDGWTRPGVTARFRVFPLPGQRVPELRTLTFVLVAPNGVTTRRASLASDSTSSTLDVTTAPLTKAVPVCVPPGRAADVRLRASGSTQIYGDQANLTTFQEPRSAGLLVAEVTLEPGGSPVRTCGP